MSWMKPKNENDAAPLGSPGDADSARGRAPMPGAATHDRVNIGKSMHIKGELTGNEDMTIDGRVDGKIFLKGHRLTIGANGRIKAEIHEAKAIVVHGEVRGNVTAEDKVEVSSTGSLHGDIRAPRVVLAEGARFKGSIDMEPKVAPKAEATQASDRSAEDASRARRKSSGVPASPARPTSPSRSVQP